MDQAKEYFAFISYKSEDVEWATWLQHELEHYHLPASFNGRTDVPQELRPVFRDIDELSAGNLPEQIKLALTNSQNLIVICSPQAAQSPWVNQEVETFISLGRTDRIFPFIVEGNSPLEFFPPALRNLPKDEERLGGDVSKKGRDAAFVKVVAGMLRVGFDSLWNRYEKEKAEEERKQREQRDNLLRLQSRFVAEKAESLINRGDSYTARWLAINALPKNLDEMDRPYIPEAEAVLRKANDRNDTLIECPPFSEPQSVCYNNKGDILLVTLYNDETKLVDTLTGAVISDVSVWNFSPSSALFCDNDQLIVAASNDEIKLLKPFTNEIINSISVEKRINCISASSKGRYIAAVLDTNEVRIWNVTNGEEIKSIILDNIQSVELSDWGDIIGIISDGIKVFKMSDTLPFIQIKEGENYYNSLCFSPSEKYLFASTHASVTKIDLETGSYSIIISDEGIKDIVVFMDDQHIAYSMQNNLCKLWNIEANKIECKKYIEYKSTNKVAISADGTKIAAHAVDLLLKIWDVKTGEILNTLDIGGGFNPSFSFSHDGKYIIAQSEQKTVNIWNILSGNIESVISLPHPAYFTVINHKGTVASAIHNRGISIIDIASGDLIDFIESSLSFKCVAIFSNDDKYLAFSSSYNYDCYNINIYDFSTKVLYTRLLAHKDDILNLNFNYNNSEIVSSSEDKYIKIWNVPKCELKRDIFDGNWTYAEFSENSNFIYSIDSHLNMKVRNNEDKIVHLYDSNSSFVYNFSTCLKKNIIASTDDNGIKIWHINNVQLEKTLEGHTDQINDIQFCPNSRQISTASSDKTIRLWDFSDEKSRNLSWIESNSSLASLCISNNKLYTYSNSCIQLRDLHSQTIDSEFPIITNEDDIIKIIPEKQMYVSIDDDNNIYLQDIKDGKNLGVLKGHTDSINYISFDPKHSYLASASNDQTVKVWDIATFSLIKTFFGHKDKVNSVEFSPDGNKMVSTSYDYNSIIWDIEKKVLLQKLEWHSDWIYHAIFSPDGNNIIAVSEDKCISIWNIDSSINNDEPIVLADDANSCVSMCPNGKYFLTVYGNIIKIWNFESRLLLYTIQLTNSILNAFFDNTGEYIIANLYGNNVAVYHFPKLQDIISKNRSMLDEIDFSEELKKKYYLEY